MELTCAGRAGSQLRGRDEVVKVPKGSALMLAWEAFIRLSPLSGVG